MENYNKKLFYIPFNKGEAHYQKLNLTNVTSKVPRPIEAKDVMKVGNLISTKKTTIEWQSVGRVKLEMPKIISPSRWRNIYKEDVKKLYPTSQMWWDIHEIHRMRLVKYKKFPEDEDNSIDVLEDLETIK